MRIPYENIQTYQRSVGLTAMPDARVQAVSDPTAYGAGMAKALMNLGDQLSTVAEKQKKEEDLDAVTEATNSMASDMLDFFNGGNGKEGLFSRKGDNAKGSVDDAKKFMAETSAKYCNSLGNVDQQRAFIGHMRENAYNYMRSAATHERTEMENASALKFKSGMDLNAKAMALNYGNQDALQSFMQKGEREIVARALAEGWDKDTTEIQKIQANTTGIKGAFDYAMEQGDTDRASNLLNTFKSRIDPGMWERLNGAVQKVQQKNEDYVLVDSAIKSATLPDGTVDRRKVLEALEAQRGPGSVRQAPDESRLVFSTADSPNWQGVTAETRTGLSKVWGALTGLGLSPEITSGKRDGGGGSWHDVGGAVDVYLGDENGRLSPEDPRVQQALEQGKETGWQEVLYHDAGSGYHLHLGNYQGDSSQASSFDASRYQKLLTLADTRIADVNRIATEDRTRQKRDLLHRINSADSTTGAFEEIDDAEAAGAITPGTANNLRGALRRRDRALSTGTPEERFFASYERNGLYKDQVKMNDYWERVARGEDIPDNEQKGYDGAAKRITLWQNHTSSGEAPAVPQEDAAAKYQEILADLWNSKSTQERVAKANQYKDDLNRLGQALDIDVNNDVSYIMNGGQ